MQIDEIFSNATQGEICPNSVLKKQFKGMDKETILKHILENGEIQISEKEREVLIESKFKEMVFIISQKIIHPQTKRPFPLEVIEDAVKSLGVAVRTNDSSKKQAIETIKQLKRKFWVERAPMKIRVTVDKAKTQLCVAEFKTYSQEVNVITEGEEKSQIEIVINPSLSREVSEFVSDEMGGVFEIIDQNLQNRTVIEIFNFRLEV